MSQSSETGKLAEEIYRGFACRFPVCCASDEFFYFPQCLAKDQDWSRWDDLTVTSVTEFLAELSSWERRLNELGKAAPKPVDRTDAALLADLCSTVREQLDDVSFHRRQPTFYLTIAGVGLAQALEQGGRSAFAERAGSLGFLLETGLANMREVPAVFRDRALEMACKTVKWLGSLVEEGFEGRPALSAMENFISGLGRINVRGDFKLPEEVFEKVISTHLGCEVGSGEVLRELEDEYDVMSGQLDKISDSISPGSGWSKVYDSLAVKGCGERTVKGEFARKIDDLLAHCIASKLVSPEFAENCPVTIDTVPPALAAVRSADSYSARPGHPPLGGTFYIFEEGSSERSAGRGHPEIRMTAAHETWPGHHLLDACRWGQKNPVRRPLERPIFYEGWACFAEQLVARTGYFYGPGDMLILAKRRMLHAVRGIVDLSLQTGRMDVERATDALAAAGLTRALARQNALRYTLHPGYQVCYTMGLRRFQSLFHRFGLDDPASFVRIVMANGEIPFEALGRAFLGES